MKARTVRLLKRIGLLKAPPLDVQFTISFVEADTEEAFLEKMRARLEEVGREKVTSIKYLGYVVSERSAKLFKERKRGRNLEKQKAKDKAGGLLRLRLRLRKIFKHHQTK